MTSKTDNLTVAVVGATGAVGRELLLVLAQRGFPAGRVVALASARSAGSVISIDTPTGPVAYDVEELTPGAFQGVDVAFFCASSDVARELAPAAVEAGALVVDNSSAFRMDPAVPLVVPEVNAHAIGPNDRLLANPNCSTIIMVTGLEPLRATFGIERIVVSTYQAVSGAGAPGLEEMDRLLADAAAGRPIEPRFFPEPCVGNVFVHETEVDPATGRNVEETKMVEEARKIWSLPTLGVFPTCVRVPVARAHSESIHAALTKPASVEQIREAIGAGRGVRVVDDRNTRKFPTPLAASDGDLVLAGHVRVAGDDGGPAERGRTVELFLCGDQLRKGAALNAVQVAEAALGITPIVR